MSQFEQPVVPPAPPAAPPIVQGELAPRPAQWPSVVGVIGIVFASLGILTGLWTAATPLFVRVMSLLMGGMPKAPGTAGPPNAAVAQWEAMASMGWVYVTEGLLNCAVWVWGLFVFIAILKRRRGSMDRAAAWAWVKIVFNVVAVAAMTFAQWISMQSMIADMGNGAGGANPIAAAQMRPIMLGTTIVGGVFSLLMYSAFPVFLLVFGRTKAAREEAAIW